ncbi:MAG: hypothetical protein JNM90_01615 [Burkholderiales bacterium]|nr:hypothetical protein [Burkholderiales bacterium]
MLRESMHVQGKEVALAGVTGGFEDGVDVPHAAALLAFAEAVVARDDARIANARAALLPALGAAGLVDAAATVAAFHGFVRIADAIGIPHFTTPAGGELDDLRAEAGIDRFYRAQAPA